MCCQVLTLIVLPTDLLGSRLEKEGDVSVQAQACLCYICAGNVEKLVACWTSAQDGASPLSLQVGGDVVIDVQYITFLAVNIFYNNLFFFFVM